MPIYEFECQSCKATNEVLMKISDPNPTVCEKCQKGPLLKKMSRTSFVLKGQGWYETDFKGAKTKDNDKKKETSSSEAKETAEPVKSEASTDSGKSTPTAPATNTVSESKL